MTVEIFMLRLDARFNVPGNGPARDDLTEYLGRIPESKRADLFQAFNESFTYNREIRVADIARVAKEQRIVAGSGTVKAAWYVCQECGLGYSLKSRGCPSCQAMTPVKIGTAEEIPDGVVPLQENCFQCVRYNPGKTFGCDCEFYGAEAIGKTMTAEDRKYCATCECRECCTEARILETDENEFRRRMIAQRNGEIPDVMGDLLKRRRATGKNTRQERTA